MVLLIDGAYLTHRALKNPQIVLTDNQGRMTGGIHGVLTTISSLCAKRKCREGVVVSWDYGVPLHRRELYKDYKPTKIPIGDDMEGYWSSINKISGMTGINGEDPNYLAAYTFTVKTLHSLLPLTGSLSIRVPNCEGDDIIAAWCKLVPQDEITIVSSDHDLYQLLSDYTMQYHVKEGYYMDKQSLISERKLKKENWRDHFLLIKAITGDKDEIPSFPDIGKKAADDYARQLITMLPDDQFITLDFLKEHVPHLELPARGRKDGHTLIQKSAETIYRNFCLGDLFYIHHHKLPLLNEIKNGFASTSVADPDLYATLDRLKEMQLRRVSETISNITESNLNDPLNGYLNKFL